MLRISLRARIFLVAATLLILVLIFGSLAELGHHIEDDMLNAQDDAALIGASLLPLLQQALVVGDLATVQQIIDPLAKVSSINRATVLDPAGRVMLSAQGGGLSDASFFHLMHEPPAWFGRWLAVPSLEFERDVVVAGVKYGQLRLTFASEHVVHEAWHLTLRLLATQGIAILALLGLLNWAIGHQLSPLRQLQVGAKRLGEGDWTYRIGVISVPEVAAVATTFNEMADELERRNRELIVARDAAESANRAKSEFLSSMSHELRTPLNSVLGYAQLMETDPNLSPESQESAAEINRAGQHLLHLVNDVLDLARIETGHIDLVPGPVVVSELCEECLGLVEPQARQRELTLELRIAALSPSGEMQQGAGQDSKQGTAQLVEHGRSQGTTRGGTATSSMDASVIIADHSRLRQVLLNFLSNAIKYNRPQGRVTLAPERRAGKVRFTVSDTGIGIPPAMQERLFTAFDRLGRENGAIEGVGIGLVITRRLVEAMGGTIGFESREGEGSAFWVELPVQPEQPAPRDAG